MLRTLDSTQIGMKNAKNSHNVPLALPGHARSSVNTPDLTVSSLTVTGEFYTITGRPGHARSRSCQHWEKFRMNRHIDHLIVRILNS